MKLSASPNRSYRSNNSSAKRDALFCEWKSYTHNRCHKPGDPGLPFCAYRSAATVGMARGASSPDSEKRAKFEQVWNTSQMPKTTKRDGGARQFGCRGLVSFYNDRVIEHVVVASALRGHLLESVS